MLLRARAGCGALCIQATSGEATAATIPAVSTGSTITYVSASSQMMPTSNSATPTRSHDICPAPRSHCGTQTIWLRSREVISAPSSALPLDAMLARSRSPVRVLPSPEDRRPPAVLTAIGMIALAVRTPQGSGLAGRQVLRIDRMLPAGSLNQAMSGPSPCEMPFSSCWAPS